MVQAGRMTTLTMGAAAAALLGATATAAAAGADPGAPWHQRFHPHRVAGTVSSVNGSSAAGACGTAGRAGKFTVTAKHDVSDTVDVGTTTGFLERHVTAPSFANVCVGELVGAIGAVSGTTLDANDVFVAVPPPTPATAGPALAKVTSAHTDSTVASHAGTPRPDNGPWNGPVRDPGWGFTDGRGTRGRGPSRGGPSSFHGRH